MNGRDMVRVSDGAHFYITIFFKKVGTTKMQERQGSYSENPGNPKVWALAYVIMKIVNYGQQ
jgi:hypothetical protein